MARPIRLEDLPEAILIKIALYLGSLERRMVLPLVSRGWARLLGGPSPAWQEITISRFPECKNMTRGSDCRPNLPAMEAWLSRRAGAVRDLYVSRFQDFPHCVQDYGPIFPATLLAAALGTHAPQLQNLVIELSAIALSSADLNAALGHAPNLEYVCLYDVPASWNGWAAALMQTLSRLPALHTLSIQSDEAQDNSPTVVELAALSSAQLTLLEMDLDTSSQSTLTLGDLPALTNCELAGRGEATMVHVTASSFSGAPNLTALFFCNPGSIQLAPDTFTSLSFLIDLRLTDCGLHVVPPALAGVQCTLRHLDLGSNSSLRVKGIGYGVLLSLSALEHLDLSKAENDTDVVWDIRSVQYLSRFLTEWQALRPGVELPTLILDNRR